ncbi:gametocyte-specific factor 1 isoform X1 [Struthio camelus]|uniref:gametocyte-specific factor 1-like isoform X2 n=1 Tax=Struthio camelus TaxID=8801 RepID=UPI00360428CD
MEVEDDFDVLDPERLVQCPYNKHHRIRACRFPYHLVKCRKSYPQVAKELATCPFNARHLVPQADLRDHISNCRDKRPVEEDIVSESSDFQRRQMNTVSAWQAPPCEEDWDRESSEKLTSLFVQGVVNCGINSSSLEHKNCLPPGLRAPKSIPHAVLEKAVSNVCAALTL